MKKIKKEKEKPVKKPAIKKQEVLGLDYIQTKNGILRLFV